MQLTDYEMKCLNKLGQKIQDGQISNTALVAIMQQCEAFLNLKRVSSYAKDNAITPQGVRKCRNIIYICNYALVIDNL